MTLRPCHAPRVTILLAGLFKSYMILFGANPLQNKILRSYHAPRIMIPFSARPLQNMKALDHDLFNPPLYMRENGTVCAFGFFPVLIVFLCPNCLKCSVFEGQKGAFRGSKKTNGECGLQKTHKQRKCPKNQGKPNKTTIGGLITGISLKLDQNCYKIGEKRQKDR